MNTTDDVIGVLHERINALESKLDVLCAMLDGRAETDSVWRSMVDARLDALAQDHFRSGERIG